MGNQKSLGTSGNLQGLGCVEVLSCGKESASEHSKAVDLLSTLRPYPGNCVTLSPGEKSSLLRLQGANMEGGTKWVRTVTVLSTKKRGSREDLIFLTACCTPCTVPPFSIFTIHRLLISLLHGRVRHDDTAGPNVVRRHEMRMASLAVVSNLR